MKFPADYGISLDTEFIGSDPINNQITQFGAALKDIATGKILESFKIGPIRVERKWNPVCRAWWDKEASMKELLKALDENKDTILLKDAVEQFVARIDAWGKQYNFAPRTDSKEEKEAKEAKELWERESKQEQETESKETKRETKEVKTTWTEPKYAKCCWMTDTVSVDVSHMNATLCTFGFPPLHVFWGGHQNGYSDVYCIKALRERCYGAGFTKEQLEKHLDAPKNGNAHDAESDAIYIGECFLFYKKLLDEVEVTKAADEKRVDLARSEGIARVFRENKQRKRTKKTVVVSTVVGLVVWTTAVALICKRVTKSGTSLVSPKI